MVENVWGAHVTLSNEHILNQSFAAYNNTSVKFQGGQERKSLCPPKQTLLYFQLG